MGEQKVSIARDSQQMQKHIKMLLNDVATFEKMLQDEVFENDMIRIGAEQELCLVDLKTLKPAPIAMQTIESMPGSPWLETELSKFNLETNLTPRIFEKDCMSKMEEEIRSYLFQINENLRHQNAVSVLTGILPTVSNYDLEIENLTPKERYFSLIESLNNQLQKENFELKIQGIDELSLKANSPLLEAANTSFQVHLQVNQHNFVKMYNIAQAISGATLSVAVNSPIVFGRRLWHESRIALFQQALDTRNIKNHMREKSPRVQFGKKWLENSILDLYKEDISRYRVLMTANEKEDAMETYKSGRTPKLKALQVHNSTVYRWNRACYGISDNGKPHLRIENRVLPSFSNTSKI